MNKISDPIEDYGLVEPLHVAQLYLGVELDNLFPTLFEPTNFAKDITRFDDATTLRLVEALSNTVRLNTVYQAVTSPYAIWRSELRQAGEIVLTGMSLAINKILFFRRS